MISSLKKSWNAWRPPMPREGALWDYGEKGSPQGRGANELDNLAVQELQITENTYE